MVANQSQGSAQAYENVTNSVVTAGSETPVGVREESPTALGTRVAETTLVWNTADHLPPGMGRLIGCPDKNHNRVKRLPQRKTAPIQIKRPTVTWRSVAKALLVVTLLSHRNLSLLRSRILRISFVWVMELYEMESIE